MSREHSPAPGDPPAGGARASLGDPDVPVGEGDEVPAPLTARSRFLSGGGSPDMSRIHSTASFLSADARDSSHGGPEGAGARPQGASRLGTDLASHPPGGPGAAGRPGSADASPWDDDSAQSSDWDDESRGASPTPPDNVGMSASPRPAGDEEGARGEGAGAARDGGGDGDDPSRREWGEHGCEHYRRRCRLRAKCCGELHWCRFCHNEKWEGDGVAPKERHAMDRHETEEVECALCGDLQPVAAACRSCGVAFGEYTCMECRLFDDDTSKAQYHCARCGICRVGGRDNFWHCDRCAACFGVEARESHVCINEVTKQQCPVCMDYLFDSVRRLSVLPCGHVMHHECHRECLSNRVFKCPWCLKSTVDLDWASLDEQVRQTPMPLEYRDCVVEISCNDCQERCMTPFHVLGLRCRCGSYNTTQISRGLLRPAPPDAEAPDGAGPAFVDALDHGVPPGGGVDAGDPGAGEPEAGPPSPPASPPGSSLALGSFFSDDPGVRYFDALGPAGRTMSAEQLQDLLRLAHDRAVGGNPVRLSAERLSAERGSAERPRAEAQAGAGEPGPGAGLGAGEEDGAVGTVRNDSSGGERTARAGRGDPRVGAGGSALSLGGAGADGEQFREPMGRLDEPELGDSASEKEGEGAGSGREGDGALPADA